MSNRYVHGTIVGAPPGAPPSDLLDHDLAAPSWVDTVKLLGLLVAGMLGMGALFGDPIQGMGAMGESIEGHVEGIASRRDAMKRAGAREVF
jgi:hypothetical protein